mgnify:CR=1 FL=1
MVERDAVRGVILAGGNSRRFGDGDKALADLGGLPLLAHVVDAVEVSTTGVPLLAVAGHDEGERLARALSDGGEGESEGDRVEVVVDAPSFSGPLAGLVAATVRADRPWLLVCGCDMPLVSPPAFEVLSDRASPETDAVVPVVDGHDQPLHALYRREAVVRAAAGLEGSGPRALLDRLADVERIRAEEVDVELAATVTNVNTREELDRVRERTREGH